MSHILQQWWHSHGCGGSLQSKGCRVKTGDHQLTIWHWSEISVGGLARSGLLIPTCVFTSLVSFIFLQIGSLKQILSFVPMWTEALFFQPVTTPHRDTLKHTCERELLSVCNRTTQRTPRARGTYAHLWSERLLSCDHATHVHMSVKTGRHHTHCAWKFANAPHKHKHVLRMHLALGHKLWGVFHLICARYELKTLSATAVEVFTDESSFAYSCSAHIT